MMLYQYKEKMPNLAEDIFIAPSAIVIGDVTIKRGCGVWFGTVIRGDVNSISIGDDCNIQDMCMLHVTKDKFSLIIGNGVSLGHRVTLHGCKLSDHSFVGMGSMIMDGCELGEFSILGAGSLLPPNKKIPPRMLAIGSPAKVVREITPDEERLILQTKENYKNYREAYRDHSSFKLLS